ncbi:MAG: hypothetical protein IJL66_01535 [Lachnospiraceae bacterium]|nr:hypothetical protein [Lachnospiraceae bacterium]
MEKVYKSMNMSGAAAIAIGVVMMVVGLSAGILSVVMGANLLRRKDDITF